MHETVIWCQSSCNMYGCKSSIPIKLVTSLLQTTENDFNLIFNKNQQLHYRQNVVALVHMQ